MGGYSNKGGTAPGYKTLKATDGRDSSGCATIHGFARIETNKGCRESRRHLRAGLRIASYLSRGMQECAIITQRCGPTVLGACWMRDFSERASPRSVAWPIINSRWEIRFEGETEMNSLERNYFVAKIIPAPRLRGRRSEIAADSKTFWVRLEFRRRTFDTFVRHIRLLPQPECYTRGQTSGERERIPIISIPTPLKVRRRRAFDRQHCLCSNHRFTRRLKLSLTAWYITWSNQTAAAVRTSTISYPPLCRVFFRFAVFFSFHLPFVRASRVIERAGLDSNLITIPIIPSAGGNSNSPETFGSAASTFIAARLAIVGGT